MGINLDPKTVRDFIASTNLETEYQFRSNAFVLLGLKAGTNTHKCVPIVTIKWCDVLGYHCNWNRVFVPLPSVFGTVAQCLDYVQGLTCLNAKKCGGLGILNVKHVKGNKLGRGRN